MARPVKIRTKESFQRDIAALTRLRSAVKIDESLPQTKVKKICRKIDSLIDEIVAAFPTAS